MTVRANKFTPEVLLSAPRRSAAVPNPEGTLALYTVSTYSFHSHSKTSEIRVLDIKTGQSKVLISDLKASEPTWLQEKNLVLWLKGGDKGTTDLMLADAENLDSKYYSHANIALRCSDCCRPETIATFDGGICNLKTTRLDSETIALVATGLATPSGDLYNGEKVTKPHSTGKVYTSLFVRQ